MCRKAHIIRAANIIRQSLHYLPKANIIEKSTCECKCFFLGARCTRTYSTLFNILLVVVLVASLRSAEETFVSHYCLLAQSAHYVRTRTNKKTDTKLCPPFLLDIGCILEPPTKFGCRSRTLTNIRKSDQNLRQKDLKSN